MGNTPLVSELRGKVFEVKLRGIGRLFLRNNIKVIASRGRFGKGKLLPDGVPAGVNYAGGYCAYANCPVLEKHRKRRRWGMFNMLQGEKEVVLDYNVGANNWILRRISDGIRKISDFTSGTTFKASKRANLNLVKKYQYIGEFRYRIIIDIPIVKFTLREIDCLPFNIAACSKLIESEKGIERISGEWPDKDAKLTHEERETKDRRDLDNFLKQKGL